MQVYGHRGASAHHPGNTLVAFRQAVAVGAYGIELDVRSSADGVPVVTHDAQLGDGRLVRATRAADLPGSVPTLEAVLEAGPWYLNIEVKHDPGRVGAVPAPGHASDLAGAVVVLVRAHEAAGRVLVSSFSLAVVDRIRTLDPGLATAWLVSSRTGPAPAGEPADVVHRARAHGCCAVHPEDALVDAALVERARRLGLAVNVWTVDDGDRIRELARLGVDGVITDDPAAALAALAAAPDPAHRSLRESAG